MDSPGTRFLSAAGAMRFGSVFPFRPGFRRYSLPAPQSGINAVVEER